MRLNSADFDCYRERNTVIILMMSVLLISSCSRTDREAREFFKTNAVTMECAAAIEFLREMKEKNRLPGYSKDEHGQLTSDPFPLLDSQDIYPISQTFHISKNNGSSTNHYSVSRHSKDGAWELQRAWRTDSEGHIVQEWPTK